MVAPVPVDAVDVASVVSVVVPSASAPGHSERLARYAERAERRLPLFEDGPPVPDDGPTECWGCGVKPGRATWLEKIGWASRPATAASIFDGTKKETYCPDCFAEWGWPDGGG